MSLLNQAGATAFTRTEETEDREGGFDIVEKRQEPPLCWRSFGSFVLPSLALVVLHVVLCNILETDSLDTVRTGQAWFWSWS